MKQLWKRNIVAATILLFVCAAVYLNWKYASGLPGETTTEVGQKILGGIHPGQRRSPDRGGGDRSRRCAGGRGCGGDLR